jgi:hypothetical protein
LSSKKGEHRDQPGALVAVDEWLGLGDPAREHGSLAREIRLLVVCVNDRATQRTLERLSTAQMIAAQISSASSNSR